MLPAKKHGYECIMVKNSPEPVCYMNEAHKDFDYYRNVFICANKSKDLLVKYRDRLKDLNKELIAINRGRKKQDRIDTVPVQEIEHFLDLLQHKTGE